MFELAPTSRLLWIMTVGLVLAGLPVLVAEGLWVVVVGAWLGLMGAGLWDVGSVLRSRLGVRASWPQTVGVGDALMVRAAVQQRAGRGLRAVLRTEVDAPLVPGADNEVLLGRGSSTHEVAVDAPRRGTGHVRALWVDLQGPLGLMHRVRRFALEGEPVRVLPNTRYVRELAVEYFGTRLEQGHVRMNQIGQGTELDALDAYQPGMDLRSVDWKSSARHHALRVRRFQLERNQHIALCLDAGRLMGDAIHGIQRLDHAIHTALLLGYAALKANDLVAMHAYSAEPEAWLPPRAGLRQLRRLTDVAAGLSPRDQETNHVLGMHDLLTRLDRRSLVVVFTELTDPTTTELMVEYVGHLARRHLVVFMALDDPAIEAPFASVPGDVQAIGQATVAGMLRQDRQRVLKRLRGRGVDVVHGPPRQAALHLLQRYVRLKRRRLLG